MNTENAIHEREVLIKAFSDVTKEFEGREWIIDGRGCYAFNDDEYRKEVTYLFQSFSKIKSEMWCKIDSKTFEYKNHLEEPLLNQISDMKAMLSKLLMMFTEIDSEGSMDWSLEEINTVQSVSDFLNPITK